MLISSMHSQTRTKMMRANIYPVCHSSAFTSSILGIKHGTSDSQTKSAYLNTVDDKLTTTSVFAGEFQHIFSFEIDQ